MSEEQGARCKVFCFVFISFFFSYALGATERLHTSGASIKIEVVSRFEQSSQLYQQGAISPLFLGGRVSGCILPQKIKALKCDFQHSALSFKKM